MFVGWLPVGSSLLLVSNQQASCCWLLAETGCAQKASSHFRSSCSCFAALFCTSHSFAAGWKPLLPLLLLLLLLPLLCLLAPTREGGGCVDQEQHTHTHTHTHTHRVVLSELTFGARKKTPPKNALTQSVFFSKLAPSLRAKEMQIFIGPDLIFVANHRRPFPMVVVVVCARLSSCSISTLLSRCQNQALQSIL